MKDQRHLADVQEIVPGVLFVARCDPQWTVLWISDDIAELAGVVPEALVDNRELTFKDLIHPEDQDHVVNQVEQALRVGQTYQVQYRLLAFDGTERLVWEKGRKIGEDHDGVALLEGYIADLTESSNTQRHLDASESRFRQLFNGIMETAFLEELRDGEQTGRLLEANDAACELLGYDRTELREITVEHLYPAENREQARAFRRDTRKTGYSLIEVELEARDGTRIPVELKSQLMEIGDQPSLLYLARDLRDDRARQRLLQRTNRAMGILSRTNQSIVHALDPETLLQGVVEALQREGEYLLAWAAFVEETSAGPRLQGITARGSVDGWTERTDFRSSPAGESGTNVVATAFRQGRRANIVFEEEPADDLEGWLCELHANGIRSLCVLPWQHQGGTGLLGLASEMPDAFAHTGELEVLDEAVGDMGFGIAALQNREALRQAVVLWEQTLEQTIYSMGRSLEERDPYTSGHQERVGELVVAIGEELGLDADRILGLKLGAWIHDVGKIKVPMEILNKPGVLNNNEFAVIKEHPEVGVRILGDIEFRWPIWDMVRHHHERLDGSGYPDGLTAESLSQEVRILAVADTVEAVTGHRPYRPGRGIEEALAILRQDRGIKLDADVVDACLRLFDEGRFAWSES